MSELTNQAAPAGAKEHPAKVENAGPLLVVDIGKKQRGKRIRDLLSLTNLWSVFAIVGEHGTTIRM